MTICIVVARYNENVEWTKQFPNTIIYNKGQSLNDDYNEIFLENVGREGHTYYKYICDNYDTLDEYTIFLQGRPFDHSPNIINDIHTHINNKDLNIDFQYLCEVRDSNLSGCWMHGGLPLIQVYEHLFNERRTDMHFQFGCGAQFIVSRERILKRSKEFYSKIVKMLEYSINPIEGYVIERFHQMIFN